MDASLNRVTVYGIAVIGRRIAAEIGSTELVFLSFFQLLNYRSGSCAQHACPLAHATDFPIFELTVTRVLPAIHTEVDGAGTGELNFCPQVAGSRRRTHGR